MRLWHQSLIPYLPRQQLLGQHRECCALRGRGWGRNHSTVNYVFEHSSSYLIAYHYLVMDEMKRRGYNPDAIWYDKDYRGKAIGYELNWVDGFLLNDILNYTKIIYPEHNDKYLQECIENLKGKGIEIAAVDSTIAETEVKR